MLTDEANTTGYIPKEHLSYLPYTSKRHKKGWLAAHINQKDYVKTAIRLAIRKSQAKGIKSGRQTVYLREVDTLRNKVYTLLYYNQQKQQ